MNLRETTMKSIALLIAASVLALTAQAKLPPPSDEAKAKAAEAATKAAHAAKVEGFELCKSQDKAAAHYRKTNKNASKPLAATPPCTNPGPLALTVSAPGAAAAPAAKAAAAPAAKK